MLRDLKKWAHIGLSEEENVTDEDRAFINAVFEESSIETFEDWLMDIFKTDVILGQRSIAGLSQENLIRMERHLTHRVLEDTVSRRYKSEEDDEGFFI